MASMVHLTDEQRAVVHAIAHEKHNAIVNAVAGSGKTRTALAASVELLSQSDTAPGQRTLLVAYNKRLQQDMRTQLEATPTTSQSLKSRVEIRTIHGLGHCYFGGHGLTTDRDLTHWTTSKSNPVKPLPDFSLVVIDEAQDLTPVLFTFLHYVLTCLRNRPQLLVLGDPFQLLYRFRGAEEAYILNADSKFGDVASDAPFHHFKLTICFRITHEMAAWVNANLNPNNLKRAKAPYSGWFDAHRERIAAWWGHGIRANPARPPAPDSVTYFVRTQQRGRWLQCVIDEIIRVFEEYGTGESALLSPSIVTTATSPVRLITNHLTVVNGVQQSWFFDDGKGRIGGGEEEEMSTSDVRKNKRIASTIHKFKGRERDAIVLVGLDSFPENIEKNDPRNVFNMFYVGATRARKRLLIVQWSNPAYATHLSRKDALFEEDNQVKDPYQVTRVLDYCPYDVMLCDESDFCLTARDLASVTAHPLARNDYIVRGTHCAKRLRTLENVSSVIGVALEVRLQLLLDEGRLELPVIEVGGEDTKNMPYSLINFLSRVRNEARKKREYNWAEVLEIATALLTLTDRLYARWRQVQDFRDWHVVEESKKLDDVVMNLVHLLFVPFCGGGESEASQVRNSASVGFDEKLARLKELRRSGRLRMHVPVEFYIGRNREFVRQYSDTLIGEMDIMLISEKAARLLQMRTEKDKEENEDERDGEETRKEGGVRCVDYDEESELTAINDDDNDNNVKIVEVKATSKTSHDHLLQVGCYGAMWREQIVSGMNSSGSLTSTVFPSEGKKKKEGKEKSNYGKPEMFVAYPNLGVLRRVEMHMDSYEFLHRIGFRKINRPFDENVLVRRNETTAVVAGKEEIESVEDDEEEVMSSSTLDDVCPVYTVASDESVIVVDDD